jgi:hypothetical protein
MPLKILPIGVGAWLAKEEETQQMGRQLNVPSRMRTFVGNLRLFIFYLYLYPSLLFLYRSQQTGVKTALEHLTQTHAFGLQEDGELWRARPFSAVPTAFPDCTGEQPGASNQLILCANFTAS